MEFVNDNPSKSKWKSKSGQDGEYILVQFDAGGYLINDAVCGELRRELLDYTKGYTDVVVICHGWTTKLEDDGSLAAANKMVPSFHSTIPPDRKCLYVAVSWPSHVPSTVFQGNNKAPRELILDVLKELIKVWAKGNSPVISSIFKVMDVKEKVGKLKDLIEKFLDAKKAPEESDEDEELPEDLSNSIADLSNELRKQGARLDESTTTMLDSDSHDETAETVNEKFKIYRDRPEDSLPAKDAGDKKEGATGIDKPGDTVVVDRSFALFSTAVGVVSTAKKTYNLLITLLDVIYTSFERRAAVVGSHGLHDLLAHMMKHALKPVRFHLFGHSMGAHLSMSAAIGRGPTGSNLPRKIHSLMMTQPACSTDVFAKGGPYRPIVSKLCPVAGPILATMMENDEALRFYDAFRTKPLGRFGFFNQEPFKKRDIIVLDAPKEKENQFPIQPEVFTKNCVYNLRGKSVISNHGDIQDKEISSLFWQAAVIDMEDTDYDVTDPSELPKTFWSDYEVRNEGKLKEGWFWEKHFD